MELVLKSLLQSINFRVRQVLRRLVAGSWLQRGPGNGW
jgi:hypothetical protein